MASAASRVEVDVLRPRDLAPEIAAQWLALQRQDPAYDSPFLSPCWTRAVEAAKGGDDLRVAVLSQGGRARGFMSARVGPVTAFAAGGVMCDYEAVVAEPGLEIDAAKIVRALGVQRLDFAHMLEEQAAFAPHAKGRAVSWLVDAPDGYEAYAAQRKAEVGVIKDTDRKRRKAEREVGEVVFTARADDAAAFERLVELKRGQYRATGQTDIFDAGWTLQLARNLAGVCTPTFGGALFTLHIGGELAAVQFHLMGERTIHAWLIGHEDKFERYSPGLLLFQDILRWMDTQPYTRLDLGYGDYRFKRELSNRQQGVTHGFVGGASPAALVRKAAYGVRRAAEALPLGRFSELPGKAMRRLDLLRGLR
ncbi:MAG TPA: GNAT family N-acetyltransferase [Caulobacteraceae bacterium]|jgi:CelD/BcsL family acetyltransferase involved in cellulose biosynthesis